MVAADDHNNNNNHPDREDSDIIWTFETNTNSTGNSYSHYSKNETTPHNNRLSIRLAKSEIAGSLSKSTGWTTWDSAFAIVNYLTRHRKELIEHKRVCDIATGNGLVALSVAALGAEAVLATEIEACVALPKKNVALNCCCCYNYNKTNYNAKDGINNESSPEEEEETTQQQHEPKCWACRVDCQVYHIGASSTSNDNDNHSDSIKSSQQAKLLFQKPYYDLVIICDLLFISIRDGFDDALRNEIIHQCKLGAQVLFAYEERVCNKEAKFLSQFLDESKSEVIMEEVPSSEIDTTSSKPEGFEDDDSSDFGVELFYESPPVRFFMFQKRGVDEV